MHARGAQPAATVVPPAAARRPRPRPATSSHDARQRRRGSASVAISTRSGCDARWPRVSAGSVPRSSARASTSREVDLVRRELDGRGSGAARRAPDGAASPARPPVRIASISSSRSGALDQGQQVHAPGAAVHQLHRRGQIHHVAAAAPARRGPAPSSPMSGLPRPSTTVRAAGSLIDELLVGGHEPAAADDRGDHPGPLQHGPPGWPGRCGSG